MTEDAGSRWIALVGAASLHIALGLALLSAFASGVPLRGKADTDRGQAILVNVVPFERPGVVQNKAQATGSDLGSKESEQPQPTKSRGGMAPPVTAKIDGAVDADSGPTGARPPAATASANLPAAEVLAYRARLEAHLARYRVYPASARRAREQGVVVLRLLMNGRGQVIDVWVESSSGVTSIDDEALAAATRAEPLPSFPAGWPERMSIAIPVKFGLD